MAGKIRVLVVDDSMFYRAAIVRSLAACPDLEVVGEAYDPYDARDKILELEPDIMTLDIQMPYMSGIEFLKVLLPQWPIPVVTISSAYKMEREAREAGAQEFIRKPTENTQDSHQKFSQELISSIRRLAEQTRNRRYRVQPAPVPETEVTNTAFSGLIALGASTGGTQSTAKILRSLPKNMPGFIIVQHMPPDFTRMYAENLDRDCAMSVREARDGDTIERGLALIAPGGDRQCEIVRRGGKFTVRMYPGQKVSGHCPSVDVLFRSVAKAAGPKEAIGVILTGMGADGAHGLLEMRKKGHYTIGQDEASSVVYGMPREAFLLGAVCVQASLENIAAVLQKAAK